MTIPNMLSLARLCVVPLVPLVYFSAMANANIWAAVIYMAASLTDVLDGYIARKYNLITQLGRVLDPLADKLMTFCVLVCLIINRQIPFWAGVVFFVKEALTAFGSLVLYKKRNDVLPSNMLGKISATVFFSVCVVIMACGDFIPEDARLIMIGGALALNIIAFLLYIGRYIQNIKKKR